MQMIRGKLQVSKDVPQPLKLSLSSNPLVFPLLLLPLSFWLGRWGCTHPCLLQAILKHPLSTDVVRVALQVLFELARHHAPSTVFLDEIDALMMARGGESEHEASRRMKTELLIQVGGWVLGTKEGWGLRQGLGQVHSS